MPTTRTPPPPPPPPRVLGRIVSRPSSDCWRGSRTKSRTCPSPISRATGVTVVLSVLLSTELLQVSIILIGPIPWGHSGPLCHALSLLLWTSILHCHSPGVATVARRLRYSYSWLRLILVVVSTVATRGELQCKIRTGGVRRLAVANGPNIFQMLLVIIIGPHRQRCKQLLDASYSPCGRAFNLRLDGRGFESRPCRAVEQQRWVSCSHPLA